MTQPLPEFPLPAPQIEVQVLDLATLPPRIARMVTKILDHQDVLCLYPFGSVELHWKGVDVKAHLGKVPLEE